MFFPIQIPPVPGFGFTSIPTFQTDIADMAGGRERRNAEWSVVRHRFTAPYKNIPSPAYLEIKRVFLICRGRAHTFLHRDWSDFSAADEPFGIGDGATKVFQLSKLSQIAGVPGATYTRIVNKPDVGVVVKVSGVPTAATVSMLTGTVTFDTPPALGAQLTWSGEFFVQVRFDADTLPWSLDDKNASSFVTNGSVDLMEVLDE